jgi:hypothetical protein
VKPRPPALQMREIGRFDVKINSKIFVAISILGFAANAKVAFGQGMTVGDLQQICISPDAQSKSACRFYIFGVTQGIGLGMSIADGKTDGGRPCVPNALDSAAIELAVKIKMGQDLMVYPDDRKLDASGFVGGILVSTFPCGGRTQSR